MLNYIFNLNPILQALIAGIFSWSITSLGSLVVFFLKKENKTLMDAMLSVATGIMIAASFFSLILPAIEMSNNLNIPTIIVLPVGIILGGLLIILTDKIFSKFNFDETKRSKDSLKKCLLLILSITIHNIPEGLAIGVAFGSIIYNLDSVTVISSWLLAIGIGIQNFPEGAAVSLPLYREGFSKKKSFFFGQISGIVEPISSVIGALIVMKVKYLLPYFLAFASGAMIYVVVIELIPESQSSKYKNLMAFSFLIGFIFMMILDMSLG